MERKQAGEDEPSRLAIAAPIPDEEQRGENDGDRYGDGSLDERVGVDAEVIGPAEAGENPGRMSAIW